MLGFCWGGWVAFHCAKLPGVACAVGVHPSVNMEGFHGGNTTALYGAIRCPTMCLTAGDDPSAVKPSGELETALRSDGSGCSSAHCFKEFPEMRHGWVVRGDCGDPAIQEAVVDAVSNMVAFLKKHLLKQH